MYTRRTAGGRGAAGVGDGRRSGPPAAERLREALGVRRQRGPRVHVALPRDDARDPTVLTTTFPGARVVAVVRRWRQATLYTSRLARRSPSPRSISCRRARRRCLASSRRCRRRARSPPTRASPSGRPTPPVSPSASRRCSRRAAATARRSRSRSRTSAPPGLGPRHRARRGRGGAPEHLLRRNMVFTCVDQAARTSSTSTSAAAPAASSRCCRRRRCRPPRRRPPRPRRACGDILDGVATVARSAVNVRPPCRHRPQPRARARAHAHAVRRRATFASTRRRSSSSAHEKASRRPGTPSTAWSSPPAQRR